jgi:lysozyme
METIQQMLIRHEGKKPFLYHDSKNILTIGVGWNIEHEPMRENEIALRLSNDILETQNELDSSLPFWRLLNQYQQMAMVDLCFNMGIETLKTFKTFLGLMQSKHFEEASMDLVNTAYAKQVGSRANDNAKLITMEVPSVSIIQKILKTFSLQK